MNSYANILVSNERYFYALLSLADKFKPAIKSVKANSLELMLKLPKPDDELY